MSVGHLPPRSLKAPGSGSGCRPGCFIAQFSLITRVLWALLPCRPQNWSFLYEHVLMGYLPRFGEWHSLFPAPPPVACSC